MSLNFIGNSISRLCFEPQPKAPSPQKYIEPMRNLLRGLAVNKITGIYKTASVKRASPFSRYKSKQNGTNFVKNYRKPLVCSEGNHIHPLLLNLQMFSSKQHAKVYEDGINLSYGVDPIEGIGRLVLNAFSMLREAVKVDVYLPKLQLCLPVPRLKRVTWVFSPYIDEPFGSILVSLVKIMQGECINPTLADRALIRLLKSPRIQKDIVKDESKKDDTERPLKTDLYLLGKPIWFHKISAADLVDIAMCSKFRKATKQQQVG